MSLKTYDVEIIPDNPQDSLFDDMAYSEVAESKAIAIRDALKRYNYFTKHLYLLEECQFIVKDAAWDEYVVPDPTPVSPEDRQLLLRILVGDVPSRY